MFPPSLPHNFYDDKYARMFILLWSGLLDVDKENEAEVLNQHDIVFKGFEFSVTKCSVSNDLGLLREKTDSFLSYSNSFQRWISNFNDNVGSLNHKFRSKIFKASLFTRFSILDLNGKIQAYMYLFVFETAKYTCVQHEW